MENAGDRLFALDAHLSQLSNEDIVKFAENLQPKISWGGRKFTVAKENDKEGKLSAFSFSLAEITEVMTTIFARREASVESDKKLTTDHMMSVLNALDEQDEAANDALAKSSRLTRFFVSLAQLFGHDSKEVLEALRQALPQKPAAEKAPEKPSVALPNVDPHRRPSVDISDEEMIKRHVQENENQRGL